jgi:hypothetical protein
VSSRLAGAYVIVSQDVSSKRSKTINVSDEFMVEVRKTLRAQIASNIQFGIHVVMMNDTGDSRKWYLSNKALRMSDTFINDGVSKLEGKIAKFSECSSNYSLTEILEVNMTILRTSPI